MERTIQTGKIKITRMLAVGTPGIPIDECIQEAMLQSLGNGGIPIDLTVKVDSENRQYNININSLTKYIRNANNA